MKAIIITIGDEILMGQILDTNSQYIADKLTDIGVDVVEMFSIADKPEEIRYTVDYAMSKADFVAVTGGLGPTKDDVTKKVLADYFNSNLVLNNEAYSWLEELLKNRSMNMNAYNKTQAILPDNCKLLRNYKGTACGMWFDKDGHSLVSMPGVPFEMMHLMDTYVVSMLKERYHDLLLSYKILKVYDITESELAISLDQWEKTMPEGMGLAYLPSPGMIKLRITAKESAVSQLEEYYKTLKLALGNNRYTEGEDTSIEQLLYNLLKEKGCTLSVAESCTGGNIARMITSVQGASQFFNGGVVAYTNDVKTSILGVKSDTLQLYSAVSGETAREMALGVRRLTKSTYALATTGIAGPTGATANDPIGTVWIALATPTDCQAERFVFSATRERNIAKASMKALEMLYDKLKLS